MNKFMLSIGFVSAALLAACDNSQLVKDENSPYYSVSVGSTFTLNREITIQPDQTSVYLQYGKIELVRDIDFYKPHCKFELYTISEQSRLVEPDTFAVTRIVDQKENVAAKSTAYAGLEMTQVDGPIILTYATTMYLESKLQPDVFRMTCKRWDWPVLGEYLSINEMRQALGDYFTLTLAD
jgi:hypothetical protein